MVMRMVGDVPDDAYQGDVVLAAYGATHV